MTSSSTASTLPTQQSTQSRRTSIIAFLFFVVYVLVVTLFILLAVFYINVRQHMDRVRQDIDELQATVAGRQSSTGCSCDDIILLRHREVIASPSRSIDDVSTAPYLRAERKRRSDASPSARRRVMTSSSDEEDDRMRAGSGELTDSDDVMMNVISKVPVIIRFYSFYHCLFCERIM